MEQKHIGQLISVRFEYSKNTKVYSGYLIDYNTEWVLLKYNPTDYVIDGFIILRNKYVTEYKRDGSEKFKQKILDLKGCKPKAKEKIPIDDLETILTFLSNKHWIFQFNMKTDDSCWLGTLKKIDGSNLKIDYLTPRATWVKTTPPFKPGNIRTIEYDTDYINSLKLIARKKN